MIRAILFDYDGVLTTDKTGSLTTYRYLSNALGVDISVVQSAFGPYGKDLVLGRTTHEKIWPDICRVLGQGAEIAVLNRAFESTPANVEVFSLARGPKDRYALGIVTDNKKDRMDHLRKLQGLDALFDPIVVSAEVGSDKSCPLIFEHALRRLNLEPKECIFIDNSRVNLIAADVLGLRTILHDDDKNDIDALVIALRAFGVDSDTGLHEPAGEKASA